MSSLKCTLCQHIARDYFGNRVSTLFAFLAFNGSSTLKDIVLRGKIPRSVAVKDLQILLQHNFVTFDENLDTKYTVNLDFIVQKTRFFFFVGIVKKLYGKEAEMLMKEFVKHRRLEKDKCIAEALSQVEADAGLKKKLLEAFKKLEMNMLITKSEETLVDKDKNNYDNNDDDVAADKTKSNKTDKVNKGRKRVIESSDEEETSGDKNSTTWSLHTDKLNELLRHEHIIQAVTLAQDEECSKVIETILHHSITPTSHKLSIYPPISFNQLINITRKESKMTGNKLSEHLTNLVKYQASFLLKCDESGGGLYNIDLKKAFRELCLKHVCCCIEEIYGTKAKNIFNIILSSVMIEENEIEKKSRDPESVKAVLAKLRKEQYISTMSFPKTSDYNSLNTIYVYKIDLDRVARLTLERCYQAAANLIIRRAYQTDANKRLLEIQTKLDVVFSQMDDDEQKEELQRTYISAVEQNTLRKYQSNMDMLDTSELQLEETTFVMETYLNLNKIIT